MKALTVQQPWAWAIVHGGKNVENRTQAWSYRGPLAIHAGLREDVTAYDDEVMRDALGRVDDSWELEAQLETGVILGVVDLVDVHRCALEAPSDRTCCRPWGRRGEGGWTVHLVLANPRPLATPIPATGRLGLWTPDDGVLEQLRDEVTSA